MACAEVQYKLDASQYGDFIKETDNSNYQSTLMQALLDFTLSSREALQKAVVFLIVSVTGRVLFPVRHAEAASSEAVSVLWVGGRGKIGC